ncbi:39S ribosomal protein L24, mitochondrial [Sorochytrium milnesiophthora]
MSRFRKFLSFPLTKIKGYNLMGKKLPKVKDGDKVPADKWVIYKNDTVRILAGDDKGKTGKVVRVVRDKNQVFVEGMKLISKHVPRTSDNPRGGVFKMESGIHVSNVALVDPQSGNPTSVRVVRTKDDLSQKFITRRLSKASGLEIPRPGPDLTYQKNRKKDNPLDTLEADAHKVTYEPSLEAYPFPRSLRLVNHGTF